MKTLSEEELALITALYLRGEPLTEAEYADQIGVTQQALNKRKKTIFKKIRNYF